MWPLIRAAKRIASATANAGVQPGVLLALAKSFAIQ